MLGWLTSIFTGPVIDQLTHALSDAYKAKLNAQTEAARIAADQTIEGIKAEMDARRQQASVLIAEQGNWLTRMMRPAFAYPVALYYGKIFLWDKTLGMGATDALSPELNQVAMVIIGALFLHSGAQAIGSAIRGRR